jgi:hypothetical protein
VPHRTSPSRPHVSYGTASSGSPLAAGTGLQGVLVVADCATPRGRCAAEFGSMGSRAPHVAARLSRVVLTGPSGPIHDAARGLAGRARSRPGRRATANRAGRVAANATISPIRGVTRATSVPLLRVEGPPRLSVSSGRSPGLFYASSSALRRLAGQPQAAAATPDYAGVTPRAVTHRSSPTHARRGTEKSRTSGECPITGFSSHADA